MGQIKRLAAPISLTIEYEDADGDVTMRDIRISGIGTSRHGVYFEAWCALRREERTFRIDRIKSVVDADGVVLDPAPEIGRVLMEAQSGQRAVIGRTKHQRAMDEANAANRAHFGQPDVKAIVSRHLPQNAPPREKAPERPNREVSPAQVWKTFFLILGALAVGAVMIAALQK